MYKIKETERINGFSPLISFGIFIYFINIECLFIFDNY